MNSGPALFVLVLVIGLAVVALFAYLEHQRTQALRAECASRGWTYRSEDASLVDRWGEGPFGAGHSRRARHVVTGECDGRSFVAFEYSYKETSGAGSSRRTTTYTYAVHALTLPVPLPTLVVEPEGWLSRLADVVGVTDEVDVESEAFNHAFSVRADDRKFAYDVLHPRHLEDLLGTPARGWWIEGANILTADEDRLDLGQVVPRLQRLARVVGQIPSFVWQDRGYDPDVSTGR